MKSKYVNSHISISSPTNSSGQTYISVSLHEGQLRFIQLLLLSKTTCYIDIKVFIPTKKPTTLAFQFSIWLDEDEPVYLQVLRVPEDVPVPEPASEPHDET